MGGQCVSLDVTANSVEMIVTLYRKALETTLINVPLSRKWGCARYRDSRHGKFRLQSQRDEEEAWTSEKQIMRGATPARAREISALMERWREEQWKHVGNVLEEDQVVRLKQILFQHHCSRVQIPWALFMAAKPFDPDNRDHGMIANDVQEQANFRWQAERLSKAFDALAETIGKSKARKVCGELTVFPHIFAAGKEFDAERYKEINNKLFKGGNSTNPRREGNSRRREAQ